MEDIKIPNVYKIQTATVHVLENDLRIQKSLEEELSLEDFVSVIKKKESASYIDGFTDVIYRGAAKEEVGVQVKKAIEDVNYLILDEIPPEEIEDLEVATYLVNHKAEIEEMTSRGEFDHCGSSAGMMFVSEMADCLILPALVKAITGYDYITGEQLTGIQRGAKGVQAAFSIFVVGKLAASGVGLGAAVISKVGEEAVEEVAYTGGLAVLSAVCKKCNVSPEMERYLMLAAVTAAAVLQQKVEGVGEATAETVEQIGKRDELVEGVVDIAETKAVKEFLESGDEVVEGITDTTKKLESVTDVNQNQVDEILKTSLNSGLTQSQIDDIVNIPKGSRPEPSTYLSQEYIDAHLAQFDDGASIIMTKEQYINYVKGSDYIGIQSDGTQFVMPKNYCDDIANIANGDISIYEKSLGFDIGHFEDGGGLARIDIENIEGLNLRMPSGNEAGANSHWIPGGKTDGGVSEAITDLIPNVSDNIKITEIK